MKADDARRLKELEAENARLERIVADKRRRVQGETRPIGVWTNRFACGWHRLAYGAAKVDKSESDAMGAKVRVNLSARQLDFVEQWVAGEL
jgi:hypothetical protein